MLQNEIGDIKQGCARCAVTYPRACVATQPVIDRKAGPQQRNLQTSSALRCMGTADDQLCLRGTGGVLQILQVAKVHPGAGQTGQYA